MVKTWKAVTAVAISFIIGGFTMLTVTGQIWAAWIILTLFCKQGL